MRIALFAAGVLLAVEVAGAGVIKEDYESWTLFGYTSSGLYDFRDDYVINGQNWYATLKPPRATEINNTIGEFWWDTLSDWAQGTGWTFQSSLHTLSDDSLVIHTYDVQGTAARVGAEIHVEYVPHGDDPTDNIHWIQVVRDNHNVTDNKGHGNAELVVDTNSPGGRSPYYDDGFAANDRHFYDFPGRLDPDMEHCWEAELFLVSGPAADSPGLVTIYRTGISWGWQNVPPPSTLALFACGLIAARRRR